MVKNNIRYCSQKKLFASLFLLTQGLLVVWLNLDFAVFSFSSLFAGSTTCNPIPNNYYIKTALHGTCHWGNEIFGEKEGIQCTINAFYVTCFPVFKNVLTWAYFDFDYIIEQRNSLMKCLGVHKPLAVDELPLSVKLKGCGLEVTGLQHHSKRFSKVTCLLIIKNYDQQKLAMVQSLYVLESALLLLGEKISFFIQFS